MLTEQNKAAKRRYIEAFNRRDLTVFPELFAARYTLHATGFPEIHGARGVSMPSAISART